MHRHQYKGRKLGRKTAPRKALFRNLSSQLILHESITTTLPKAKEIRPIIEKLITRAKNDTVANRRIVAKFLSNKDKALEKLFVELGPLYKERNGGYTRIVKMGNRAGDNAEMAQIQLLDTEKLTRVKLEKKKEKSTPKEKIGIKKEATSESVKRSSQKSKKSKVNSRVKKAEK